MLGRTSTMTAVNILRTLDREFAPIADRVS